MRLSGLFFVTMLAFSSLAHADNVILMIGDGMGKNHIACASQEADLFLETLTPQGEIQTHSANNSITDSAAGATAYSCGLKTNNTFLALTPDKKECKTLAEMSVEKDFITIIRTTDILTGATPSAFYAHIDSRYKTKEITNALMLAQQKMDIKSVAYIDTELETVLDKLKKQNKPFFMMVEESEIDKQSHKNNYDKMKEALIRFDHAIQKAIEFAKNNQKTTVIILADHETGGLTTACKYTKNNHTGANVSYYVEGQHKNLFNEAVLQNTDIHHKIKAILFNN